MIRALLMVFLSQAHGLHLSFLGRLILLTGRKNPLEAVQYGPGKRQGKGPHQCQPLMSRELTRTSQS